MSAVKAAALAALLVFAPSAVAASPDDLTDGLESLSNECMTLAQNNAANAGSLSQQQIDDFAHSMADCMTNANSRGEAILRRFLHETRNNQIKSDARNVFAKWKAFMGSIDGVGAYTMSYRKDYEQAKATLDADAI